MIDNQNLNDHPETVNQKIEYELQMKKLRDEVIKKFGEYKNTLNYMAADAPLGVLCLPTAIENALLAHGCLRVYDLFDLDFTEVKGLGVTRIRNLTTRLDQFLSML